MIAYTSQKTKESCQFCETDWGRLNGYKLAFPALMDGEHDDLETVSFVICDACLYSRVMKQRKQIPKWIEDKYLTRLLDREKGFFRRFFRQFQSVYERT